MAWSTGEYLRMDIEAQNEWGNETIVDRRVLEPWFYMFKRGAGGRVRVYVWSVENSYYRLQSLWGMWKEYEKSVQLKNNLLQSWQRKKL